MKILRNKTKISTIAFALMLTMAATLLNLPAVNAQAPFLVTKQHYIYIVVSPNPVGVAQQVLVVWWIDTVPPTPVDEGSWSDFNLWHGITVNITDPDGTSKIMGPYKSDPVGGGYFTYVPDKTGEYTFQATWPGEWKNTTVPTGAYPNPLPAGNWWFSGCTSEPVKLTVQQEQLAALPGVDLPTNYWIRPINAYNREWSAIAGNFLADGRPNLWTTAPDTAHIVWTKPLSIMGLTGGEFGDISYYTGSAYETRWGTPVIIQGRLYYNVPRSTEPGTGGLMCVDLRTGETIWWRNGTRVTRGVIYDYESPNQHGTIPYLLYYGMPSFFEPGPWIPWYKFYDPLTGEWLFTIDNVPMEAVFFGPSGFAVGPTGEPTIYVADYANRWLALWNATDVEDLWGAPTGTSGWQWRPVGKTVDAVQGYMWNVSIPDLDIPNRDPRGSPAFSRVFLGDRIFGTTGLAAFEYGTQAYSFWALSVEEETAGTLLFQKNYTAPPIPGGTVSVVDADIDSKVFVMWVKESMQMYGYDLDEGNLLWGPTEPFGEYAMYGVSGDILNGVLYVSTNYDGRAYAFDARNGTRLWEWPGDLCGLDGPYLRWPTRLALIADGKVYLTTWEHSTTQPLYKGWKMYCIDAETGRGIWNITGNWDMALGIADGYLIGHNCMDGQIYCFGKGQTATTVTASPEISVHGNNVMIKGTVTDQSAGAKDTPAIADESMTEWMEYLYMQKPIPADAKGVEVTLDAVDPNGNWIHIDRVTSDMSGMFKKMWTPEVPGEYTIIATFEGSESYWASYAETAVGVSEAPEAPPEPEPEEEPAYTAIDLAIIAAVAVAIVIGVVNLWALRKRS